MEASTACAFVEGLQQWSNPHASFASSALHYHPPTWRYLQLPCLSDRSTSRSSAFCRAAIVDSDRGTAPLPTDHVYDAVLKQATFMAKRVSQTSPALTIDGAYAVAEQEDAVACAHNRTFDCNPKVINKAYARCGEVCAEYAKTFYIGTMLMTPERQRAMWAISVWCRRTDELVDGPNAPHITPDMLDQWERRLEDIFRGRPYDMLDAALADAVARFPLDIQPFRDMIEGMRMDLVKTRYESFDELYHYAYYVSGTVALMSVPVLGIDPQSKATTQGVYNAALALSFANQLTNILRDVGEDVRRGRIYLPKDELARFGLGEEDIFVGKVTNKWRAFMKEQIKRAHLLFDEAERGIVGLHKDSRWPVWASLILYRQILDAIKANDYDNFTKRAYVGKLKKLVSVLDAYRRALLTPATSRIPVEPIKIFIGSK